MAQYHKDFQQALHNLKMRDINEVASSAISRLNAFPTAPRDRVVTSGSTTLDYTGAFCDTTWSETVGSTIATNCITLDQMNTMVDLLVDITSKINCGGLSSIITTVSSMVSLVETNKSTRSTYNTLGYTYDIKKESTSDIRAFLERLIDIDVTADLWVISGCVDNNDTLLGFVKCFGYVLQNVEQISHILEQIQIIDYSA